ncbi:Ubiquitin-conjugating enzyme E2 pex4 [Phytophthora nicotianae]|uniref:Ubiquitin-conjugating enzyme E2 pex4 n=1 Tax=Phytophthora nicotianae TaxID=4792 RepID=A0A0W8DJN9_PHYNI|nr:Ubiquitin-conjugating enzyme E2 pex4 [Phytophthora nicotianae]
MDDDPVVREIPVHLADELRQNLCVYYCYQRSEHFDQDAEDYLKQKHLRLQSSSVPALSNYVVGVFRQGQLHLTPLSAVMQMRPSLSHIDDAANEEEEDMEVEEKVEPPPAEMKEVQFQFKKKQSERAISAIQNSFAYKKQQIDAEKWIELQVQDKSSAGADDEFENLFSEKEEEVVSTMTADEYIKAMQYRAMASADKPAAPSNPAQTNVEDEEEKDETMEPVTGRLLDGVDAKYADVLRLLATDQIMHFDTLAKLLPTRSEEELLDALKHIAVHVRGRLLPSRCVWLVELMTSVHRGLTLVVFSDLPVPWCAMERRRCALAMKLSKQYVRHSGVFFLLETDCFSSECLVVEDDRWCIANGTCGRFLSGC